MVIRRVPIVAQEKDMTSLELIRFAGCIIRENAFRLFCMLLVSSSLGYAINRVRANPLPLVYQSPQERMERIAQQKADPVTTISPTIEKIDVGHLRELAADGASLLDARPSLFYKSGHIPGALRLAAASFEEDYARLQPRLQQGKDRPIIVYCSGESCEDSELVAKALARMGFSRLYILTGGWKAWQNAGLPEDKE